MNRKILNGNIDGRFYNEVVFVDTAGAAIGKIEQKFKRALDVVHEFLASGFYIAQLRNEA